MKLQLSASLFAIVALAMLFPAYAFAGQAVPGHLLIVGGGLRPDNKEVFERLLQYAGGKERARFAIFPTASLEPSDARQLKLVLGNLGVLPANVQVIDLTVFNYAKQASNPAVVEQILGCTGVYFEGGDQTRITKALVQADGTETPALAAIREVWKRGGVVAGSSAGAAVQSKVMISVSGLPDDSLDEGLDVLDFGITRNGARRGLLVSPGLAFFTGGIIDQHFSEYRGRLGRLARVTCEERQRYGFGIDENTVLDVSPDGSFEVVGERTVTIVDSADAKCEDGPAGCRITGVRLSCLEEKDRFDPATGKATIHPNKLPIVRGKEATNGNFLIPDIAGRGAALDAMFSGLADNTSRKQIGITLKHHQHSAHGFRFIFQKTDATKCFEGYVGGFYSFAVLGARLDIEPITGTLHLPEKRLPVDLPKSGATHTALVALWRRGILLENDERQIRPSDRLTRAELAGALSQTVRLEPPRRDPPQIADVTVETVWEEQISLVVGNKLMELDERAAFRPDEQVTREEAAAVLVRLAERYRGERLADEPSQAISAAELEKIAEPNRSAAFAALRFGLLKTENGRFLPRAPLSRAVAAEAIYKVVGFPW